MMQNRLKLIGLTGNSGSGKSMVSEIMRRNGSYIIDADVLAREIVEPGQKAYYEIVDNFGEEILLADGKINRRQLGDIVFNDEPKRQILINITHKYVKEETYSRIEQANVEKDKYRCVVIDAPLLVEAEMHKIVDSVWVVYAGYDTRLRRIISRDSLTNREAEARLRSQMPYDRLKAYADVIIKNNSDDPKQLEEQVLCFMYSILEKPEKK